MHFYANVEGRASLFGTTRDVISSERAIEKFFKACATIEAEVMALEDGRT